MHGARMPQLPIDEYHGPDGRRWLTHTALKQSCRWERGSPSWTPSHFRRYMDGHEAAEKSEALKIGAAFHALAEGLLLEDVAVVIPKGIRRNTKAYTEWYRKQCEKFGITRVIKSLELRETQVDVLQRSFRALKASAVACQIFAEPKVAIEGTIRWEDDRLGLQLQSRPDLETGPSIVDWKTDRDPLTWIKRCYSRGYHRSGAMQRQAVYEVTGEWKRVLHVVVGKKPPYDVVVHELPIRALELGWSELREVMEQVKYWLDGGYYASKWEEEINREDLPEYVYADPKTKAAVRWDDDDGSDDVDSEEGWDGDD